jgi:hypothetical protein
MLLTNEDPLASPDPSWKVTGTNVNMKCFKQSRKVAPDVAPWYLTIPSGSRSRRPSAASLLSVPASSGCKIGAVGYVAESPRSSRSSASAALLVDWRLFSSAAHRLRNRSTSFLRAPLSDSGAGYSPGRCQWWGRSRMCFSKRRARPPVPG